ncbi:uncharacterized protein PODANS_7_9760 [Podospora anserina S mat+]|uniref:Podospora anserina S mat+ genomic DNA chromosome 7, supercontig 1 n=1 Tax=Podospora anserina (strain S / ATCC MYA-4624 / DSM 980 / FGSC 10383) TaxID=515849 RepID=B2AX95_PODAN|nr:uncharacterized protein PODANS_7_9760 [Podospora anserina S mat+]CAP69019.1 unnamed protein product [Podospora anserina S mat+]CDP32495.1 Putative protein of unknown function [Podospora anserina S mat+]
MAEQQVTESTATTTRLPRVTIQFCTQCKWMLRAAYVSSFSHCIVSNRYCRLNLGELFPKRPLCFAVQVQLLFQFRELICFFSSSAPHTIISPGTVHSRRCEVALQPSTGGVFIVEITTSSPATTTEAGSSDQVKLLTKILWDRKTDGGFPETKELKRRVRDVIDPGRGLGHVDKDYSKPKSGEGEDKREEGVEKGKEEKKVEEEGKVCTIEGKENCEDCQ